VLLIGRCVTFQTSLGLGRFWRGKLRGSGEDGVKLGMEIVGCDERKI
jgi:hypothetical protein